MSLIPPPLGQSDYYVTIRDCNNKELFDYGQRTEGDLKSFYKERCFSIPYNKFKAVIIPVKFNFSNLILPICFMTAYKVKNFALKFILFPFALTLDLATLSLRLVFCPLKALYNLFVSKQPHPLEFFMTGLAAGHSDDDKLKEELIRNAIKSGKFWIETTSRFVKKFEIKEGASSLTEIETKTRFMCVTQEMPIDPEVGLKTVTNYLWAKNSSNSDEWGRLCLSNPSSEFRGPTV